MRISFRCAVAHRAAFAPSILLALLCSGSALAQAGADEEAGSGEPAPPPGVEEIQIIGERRDDSTQTEAIAVTSFDQSALDEFGVQDVESLQDFVPSLHIGRVGNQAVITIRGVGLENISITGRPSVIFNVDDVPLLRPSAALSAAFFDLEDLTVLRGPQGTQGGYQTTAGRIGIHSVRPRPDFEMGGDFQYGTRAQKLSRGYVNVPLAGELLMARFSVFHEDRWGYQRGEYFLSPEQHAIALARPIYDTVTTPQGSLNPGIRARLVKSGPYDLRKRKAWGDDAKDLALRGQLMSIANEDLEIRAIGTYSQQKGVGPSPVFVAGGETFPTCPESGPAIVCPPELLGGFGLGGLPHTLAADDPRVNVSNEQQFRDNFQVGATGKVKWDIPLPLPAIGDMRIGVIGSWQKNVTQFLLDLDASNAAFTNIFSTNKAVQRSVEVYFEGVEAEDLEWKVGFLYLQEDQDTATQVDIPFASGGGGGSGAVEIGGGASVFQQQEVVTKNHSGFGELAYWLTDEIKLLGGLRFTQETQRAHEISDAGSSIQLGNIARDVTPKGEILWQFSDTNNLSFGVTKGFKPGGFVLGTDAAGGIRRECGDKPAFSCASRVSAFSPERVYQYQITSKNELFDESLTLNLTGFWTSYSSYQSCQIRAEAFECVGGGKAQLRGFEVEGSWRPYQVPGLSINGNFNFLHTRLEQFVLKDPTDPGNEKLRFRDLRGNTLPRSPRFAVNVGIQYDIDLGKYGILTPRAQYNWQDKVYFRTFNKGLDLQPAFHMADAKITWKSADDLYAVEASVDNVTDVDVLNNIITGPLIAGTPTLGFYRPPRTWGVKFIWKWL